jgi:hypothetical protein
MTTFEGNDQRIPKISAHVGVTLALPILLTGNYKISSSATNVRSGSRLCENFRADNFRATIEPGRQHGRIIIASEANVTNLYFVSIAKK